MLDITGQLAHDPQRHANRANEPKASAPIGDAPSHLSDEQKALWNELVSISLPDVLANADRWHLEMTVRLMDRLRSGTASDNNFTSLRQCLAALGMTPADRSRVSAATPQKKVDDEWNDLIPN
jgi:phage terminase small subunit